MQHANFVYEQFKVRLHRGSVNSSTLSAAKMQTAFAIILAVLHISNAEHEFLSKIYLFENKKLVFTEPSLDNGTLYYATCDRPPKHCTVTGEIDIFTPKAKKNKCEIDLKADDVQAIVPYGTDKAILVTKESSMLKTTTVHMSDCKTVDAELFEIPPDWKDAQLHRQFLDVVVFDGGFEVIVKGLSRLCTKPNEKKYCGFKFDAEGKRSEGPYIWPRGEYKEINVVSPIITDASGKGYFFVHDDGSLIGVQLDRVGGPTHVKLWGPRNISLETTRGGYSAANNLNGVCFGKRLTIDCLQNDAEGGLMFDVRFSTFKHKHEVSYVKVQNLAGGGFVVLVITCPDRDCSGETYRAYLLKIDGKGEIMGRIEIDLKDRKCIDKNSIVLSQTFVDQRGKYCAARVCQKQLEAEAKLQIILDCYSESDFSYGELVML